MRLGRGAKKKKNRAIKRFRNRAISNRDLISISINRTALVQSDFLSPFSHSGGVKLLEAG